MRNLLGGECAYLGENTLLFGCAGATGGLLCSRRGVGNLRRGSFRRPRGSYLARALSGGGDTVFLDERCGGGFRAEFLILRVRVPLGLGFAEFPRRVNPTDLPHSDGVKAHVGCFSSIFHMYVDESLDQQ